MAEAMDVGGGVDVVGADVGLPVGPDVMGEAAGPLGPLDNGVPDPIPLLTLAMIKTMNINTLKEALTVRAIAFNNNQRKEYYVNLLANSEAGRRNAQNPEDAAQAALAAAVMAAALEADRLRLAREAALVAEATRLLAVRNVKENTNRRQSITIP